MSIKTNHLNKSISILSGKWKLLIVNSLLSENKRFKNIKEELKGITSRQLSIDLKELEGQKLIKRKVYNTSPVSVEYELTKQGKTLDKVILELNAWGKSIK